MGGLLSRGDGSYQVVMVGLDGAGKSTLLYRLKTDQFVQAPPTIGFNCEKIRARSGEARGKAFTIWDVGGQERLRPLWRSYLRQADALLFVLDSADRERWEEAKLELSSLLRLSDIPAQLPVVLFANKQDLPGAENPDVVASKLGLDSACGPARPSKALGCCAVTGEGLDPAFALLVDLIAAGRKLKKKAAPR